MVIAGRSWLCPLVVLLAASASRLGSAARMASAASGLLKLSSSASMSSSASSLADAGPADSALDGVPPVFTNGAWDPSDPRARLNPYVTALLARDIYYKHVVDPREGGGWPAARRNFTIFATLFCGAMDSLGADDCEAIQGAEALVWGWVRAGRDVLVVFRGSNSPQNWITDVTSLRTRRVSDFGGGAAGTNVAAGFYNVFTSNRRSIEDHLQRAVHGAQAAAAAAAALAAGPSEDPAAPRDARVWLVGHSLGGAVALMTAAYLSVAKGVDPSGVYVYGCPRVGDEAWAQAYPLHGVTLRAENAGDIVPTLPFGGWWRHVGSAVPVRQCGPIAAAAAAAAATGTQSTKLDGALSLQQQQQHHCQQQQQQQREVVLDRLAEDDEAEAAAAAGGLGAAEAAEAVEGVAVGGPASVQWPFPDLVRDHMVGTYVKVLWSCLPDRDQEQVPAPRDPYMRTDVDVDVDLGGGGGWGENAYADV